MVAIMNTFNRPEVCWRKNHLINQHANRLNVLLNMLHWNEMWSRNYDSVLKKFKTEYLFGVSWNFHFCFPITEYTSKLHSIYDLSNKNPSMTGSGFILNCIFETWMKKFWAFSGRRKDKAKFCGLWHHANILNIIK